MDKNTQGIAIEEEYTGNLEEIDVDQPSPVVEGDEAVITTLSRILVRDKEIRRIHEQYDFICRKAREWSANQINKIEKRE